LDSIIANALCVSDFIDSIDPKRTFYPVLCTEITDDYRSSYHTWWMLEPDR
jgi:hypothetical protein